jgi:hypothetical protein
MNGGPELSSKGKIDHFPRISSNYYATCDDGYSGRQHQLFDDRNKSSDYSKHIQTAATTPHIAVLEPQPKLPLCVFLKKPEPQGAGPQSGCTHFPLHRSVLATLFHDKLRAAPPVTSPIPATFS